MDHLVSAMVGQGENRLVLDHWAAENHLHRQLDVAFNGDQGRKRPDHSAENYSRLNRLALNLLMRKKMIKASTRSKRFVAGWDKNYLLHRIST